MEKDRKSMPKILPPSLRSKNRYIIFEIMSETPVALKDFSSELWSSLMNLFGEVGASNTQMRIIRNLYSEELQRGIIRCKNDSVETVRASLAMISVIGESRSIVKITGVTGTIKSAQNKYLGMRSLDSFK